MAVYARSNDLSYRSTYDSPSQIDVHLTRSLELSHLTLFQQFLENYSSFGPRQILATLNAPNQLTSEGPQSTAIIWY